MLSNALVLNTNLEINKDVIKMIVKLQSKASLLL